MKLDGIENKVNGADVLKNTQRRQLLMLCAKMGLLDIFIEEFAEKTKMLSIDE